MLIYIHMLHIGYTRYILKENDINFQVSSVVYLVDRILDCYAKGLRFKTHLGLRRNSNFCRNFVYFSTFFSARSLRALIHLAFSLM